MTSDSLLVSFESLWHYGLPTSSPLLRHISSSIACTIPPNFTSSASSARRNIESWPVSSKVGSLHALFSVMDEDGDGQLSLCEIRSLLTKLHISPQSTDLHQSIKQTVSSCNRRTDDGLFLDFPQFTQLYASLFGASHDCSTQGPVQCENDDELLDAFCVYDTNHDGFISAAELATVLLELGLLPYGCGINAHLGKCQAYIDSVDLDGDGMVDVHEFKAMMTQKHPSSLGVCSCSFSHGSKPGLIPFT